MKLLFLTSRFPFPLEKGDKLRAYHFIKHLSAHHEIYLFAVNETIVDAKLINALQPYCKAIEVVKVSKIQSLFNLVVALFKKNIPFQTAYFTSDSGKKELKKFVATHQPDAMFCHLIRMGEYAKEVSLPISMLDYMDTFSVGMKRYAEKSNWLLKIPALLEYKRLLHYEQHIFELYTDKIIISKQDQQHIPHPNKEQIKVIPNGVDATYYVKSVVEKKYDLLFIGNLSYAPNIFAIKYAANHLMPLLKELKLAVVGATPSPEILKLESNNITILGWIEDSREAFNQSKIMIAPMFISIGLQNKILEAMAMQIPCVISSMANNALGAEPEKEVLIADTPEEFIKQIKRLLNDEVLYHLKIGRAHV